jgi:hypothetical protein
VIALHRDEFLGERRKFAAFPFLYPIESLPGVQLILILARHPARMASDAFGCVYGDSVARHVQFPFVE